MTVSFDLTGRRAVVTGAASGIGQAIAVALAAAGADVAGVDVAPLDATGELVVEHGHGWLPLTADVADAAAVDGVAAACVDSLGGLDIWVNNAARLLVRAFLSMSDEELRAILDTNLLGYVNGCRAAARRMVPQGSGRIVNVTSITRTQPIASHSAYVTTKAAAHGLTTSLAVELAPHGITVNAVAPGATDTPLNRVAWTDEVRRRYQERIPLGRVAQPEEIAGAVVFFATDAAAYVTGQELIVDGGLGLNGSMGARET